MFVAAAALRLVAISEPPLDFHATRQYHSALIARELWLGWSSDPSSEELELARAAAPPRYEPPVLETVAAAAYTVLGGESLVVPRSLSIIAWLAGGVAVFVLLGRAAGSFGAVAGTALWLFAPFAVTASRSFQPDPWMVAAIAWFAVAAVRYAGGPSVPRAVVCGVIAAVAMMFKPVAVFQVGAAFAAVAWSLRRESGRAWWGHVALFAVVAIGPIVPYYVVRWLTGPEMGSIFELSWRPELLATFGFWRGWLAQVWKTTGLLAAGMVVVAVVLARVPHVRRLLMGLTVGYVAFVMVFIYQSFTHDYYHLQLFPAVALGVGIVAQRLFDALRDGGGFGTSTVRWLAAAVVVLACADASLTSYDRLRRLDFSTEVAAYADVGEVVDHSAHCLMLSDWYSYPLRYHGRVAGRAWPQWYDFRLDRILGRPDSGAGQRLDDMIRAVEARYFIVTDLEEYARQDDLRTVLEERYPVAARGNAHLVFDLTVPSADGG